MATLARTDRPIGCNIMQPKQSSHVEWIYCELYLISTGEPTVSILRLDRAIARCGVHHTDSCKHKLLAQEVFNRWLSTLRPSWFYYLLMTHCVRCIQSIETDPQNVTNCFTLCMTFSTSSNKTSNSKLHYIEWIPRLICPSLGPVKLPSCSSMSRKKRTSWKSIFYFSIIGRGSYDYDIYPDSSHWKGSNIKSILVALWQLVKLTW